MKARKSWAMAYCGMAAALSVALMLLGAVVPVLMFIAPAVASLLIATVFVFLLGYYPLVKPRFERIRLPLVRVLCKLLLCNGAVLAMYGLVLLLVPAGSISQELKTTALAVSLATLAMGNVAFLLYDRALHNLLQVYQLVWRPKLHKMLGKR